MCGGTHTARLLQDKYRGLSPRVRGNHQKAGPLPARDGSIPACAGEPSRRNPKSTHGAVYPRVCGGTPPKDLKMEEWYGLSPRVRGNRSNSPCPCAWSRSIPACAGEPNGGRAYDSLLRVYPRVCGGTIIGVSPICPDSGLSPRVRGNRLCQRDGTHGVWSIPACAEEPTWAGAPGRKRTVYPRVCGGTKRATRATAATWGLSPRVRGNLRWLHRNLLS